MLWKGLQTSRKVSWVQELSEPFK
uniref:Uncharacterized protein n=1 Tax=Anguilla anguilla TaxID=7936 RepID=A0A0E9U4X0_ANGAN